jgi:hypothetical protein
VKGKPAPTAKGRTRPAAQPIGVPAPPLVSATTAPPAPQADTSLENVSVTGKTRYFYWFDKETINAVTKRMDLCP